MNPHLEDSQYLRRSPHCWRNSMVPGVNALLPAYPPRVEVNHDLKDAEKPCPCWAKFEHASALKPASNWKSSLPHYKCSNRSAINMRVRSAAKAATTATASLGRGAQSGFFLPRFLPAAELRGHFFTRYGPVPTTRIRSKSQTSRGPNIFRLIIFSRFLSKMSFTSQNSVPFSSMFLS